MTLIKQDRTHAKKVGQKNIWITMLSYLNHILVLHIFSRRQN